MTGMGNIMMTGRRGVIGAIMAGTCLIVSVPASAQTETTGVQLYGKPTVSKDSCDPLAAYELVASAPPSAYRTTSSSSPGGFDPAAATAICGSVTRASPLTCVTITGARAPSPSSCAGEAKKAYETKNGVTVYSTSTPGYEFYTTNSTVIGSAPPASAVRITTDIVSSCLQISDLQIFSGGVNIASPANGGRVSSSAPYNGGSGAGLATDADPASMFHSSCSGGDYLQVDLPAGKRVDRITILGRNDYYGNRDLYGYKVLSGSTVVSSGEIDGRNKVGTANLGGSCDLQSFEWRTIKASTDRICGTQSVQDRVTCNDAGSGELVADGKCNAAMRPSSAAYSVTGTAGCGYDFTATAWSAVAPTCGEASQTRTVTCAGSDGKAADASLCAGALIPSQDDISKGLADAQYWSKGAYAWPDAPQGSIKIWRMPSVCDIGSPADVRAECEAKFLARGGVSHAYVQPRSTRTIYDTRTCQQTSSSTYHWNDPTYVADKDKVCGPNTRTGAVQCLSPTNVVVADSLCDAAKRPPATQNFDDVSGCVNGQPPIASIPEIRIGWCGYTSGGNGRYACGPRHQKGPANFPQIGDLCTGNPITSNAYEIGDPSSVAGKGWSIAPEVHQIKGARCVVHYKMGYSNGQGNWISAYFDGPPTGAPGGLFIAKKP